MELSLTFLQILTVAFPRTFIWASSWASFQSLHVSRLGSSFLASELPPPEASSCPCAQASTFYGRLGAVRNHLIFKPQEECYPVVVQTLMRLRMFVHMKSSLRPNR